MNNVPQSLWDDEWLKSMMDRIAGDNRSMSSFINTSSTASTTYPWNERPRKFMTNFVQEIKKEKVEEALKSDPQFFDPKELDIDD